MESHEQEWRFTASRPDAVREWLLSDAAQSTARVEQRPMVHLLDTYYDTSDWIIHRAGYALRIRSAGESNDATLKSLRPTGGSRIARTAARVVAASARSHSSATGSDGRTMRCAGTD